MRSLIPLLETLPDPESEGVCSTEKTMEPIEDSRIPFMNFLEQDRLSDNSAKKIQIKRRATKLVVLKERLYQRYLDDILL